MSKKRSLYQQIKAKRLMQIYYAIQITLYISFLLRIYYAEYFQAAAIVITCLMLTPCKKMIKENNILKAGSLILTITVIFTNYFMWGHGGIYDEIIFAYPFILIIASIIGDKKLFIALNILISISFALNGISNHLGWYHNTEPFSHLNSTIIILSILWLTAYVIWASSNDIKILLSRLTRSHNSLLKSKKEIESLLHHDILTGLPNRMMAQILFEKMQLKADLKDSKLGLIFIDLDNFKQINDGLGHKTGDQLLKELARRFKNEINANDLLCRFAGDEFVIIIENANNLEDISCLVQSVITTTKTPFYFQNHEIICHCSIGITISPVQESSFDALIQQADTAMYYSKANGGDSFHFFNYEMELEGQNYLTVTSDIRKALREEQFELYFQPKIDLLTHKIIGAEALIRLNHPQKGMIFPDSFIPQAEKSGLIVDVGEWVLDAACRSCKSWQQLHSLDVSVAVNVSSQQFKRDSFTHSVTTALEKSQLSAEYLELEMTESLLIDNSSKLKQSIKRLKDLGVSFSIDDFGTGYSNLSYLKEFEIEVLKIDRAFIKDIDHNLKNRAIVSAMIKMAKGLSLKTVAEGVETVEIANILRSLQCEYGQGYFWAKPLNEKEFIKRLKSQNS